MVSRLPSLPRPCQALVVGASGGIGGALVAGLVAAGLPVRALARRPTPAVAGVTSGAIDVTDEASIATATAALDPGLRLAIVASGLLHAASLQPEKSMKALDGAALARSFAVNAIGPALVAKHVLPRLPREGKSVFAVLSARVGSIADNRVGGWYGYRASKAALNQMVRTLAIEVKRTRPEAIVVALHPGTVATALSDPFRGGVEPSRLLTPEASAARLLDVVDGLTATDSGGFFAYDGQPIPY